MFDWRRSESLPLGVDVGPDFVSIVAPAASRHGFVVRATMTREIPPVATDHHERKIAETIREIVTRLGVQERRCILAAPASETIARTFRVPPGMGRREAERAAALEADTFVDWPASERLVALDPIPAMNDRMLLSITRASAVERLVTIARAGGIKPVAVDVSACAWRRAIAEADAVLDCTRDRAELVIFGEPLGVSHLFPPRLIDERLASQVRTALLDARRDGVNDVQRLAILGSRFRYETLEELLRDDGYSVGPVVIGGIEAPSWTLAYGLASWSIAPRGLATR
ncbi:MAG: pilus assembly protein PilM [Candidatus Eremiobacteraeota bacterium]|nr:pilus assembly protein PilM [Candidatus Eremiobacteraeota bacterium]